MKDLFNLFIREKRFLDNISELTIRSYKISWIKFEKYATELSKSSLNSFVIGMREEGLTPGGINVKIRSINSFLSWCYENEHTDTHFKIKQIKTGQAVIKTFSDAHIKALLHFKPKGDYEWRFYAITCVLIDSGARIEEVLSLKLAGVNFEQLLITIKGKGGKERIIPISPELRKILYLFESKHRVSKYSEYLFSTKDGTKMMYRNYIRALREVCEKLGITEVRLSPHGFRHYFSLNYLKQGGDIYTLSRILGHTTISTTQVYLRSMGIEQIRDSVKFSPLSKLKQ